MEFQADLADFTGLFIYSLPSGKPLQQLPLVNVTLPSKVIYSPIPGALTVFIDGSGKTTKSAIVWFKNWRNLVTSGQPSTQRAELNAAIMALQHFSSQPLNMVTDTQYVVYVVKHIEEAIVKELNDQNLLSLFLSLQSLIDKLHHLLFITCIYSHSNLPGPLTLGNEIADQLVGFSQASKTVQHSHEFFH